MGGGGLIHLRVYFKIKKMSENGEENAPENLEQQEEQ